MIQKRSSRGFEISPALMFTRVLTAAALTLLPVAALPAAAVDEHGIEVHVKKNGAEVIVDVDCSVSATLAVTWEVLTDYDHMAEFLSNVKSSNVQTRNGQVLHVYQKGKAERGLLSITYENLREVELVPYQEIRSRLISGDMKASAFTTRVVDDGTMVHILHSGRYTPKLWVPPVVGPALIEAETRKHFGELRAEILRRNALGPKTASGRLSVMPSAVSAPAFEASR